MTKTKEGATGIDTNAVVVDSTEVVVVEEEDTHTKLPTTTLTICITITTTRVISKMEV